MPHGKEKKMKISKGKKLSSGRHREGVYGVAMISRLLNIINLFAKYRSLL